MKKIRPLYEAKETSDALVVGRFLASVMAALMVGRSASAQPTDPPQTSRSPPAADTAPSSSAAPAPSTPSAGMSPQDKEAQAKKHYMEGVKLKNDGAWAAALTQFLQARKLHPTRSNTSSTAYCFGQLQRYDESLNLFEILLRDFPDVPAEMKGAVQKEIVKLHRLVGTVEISGAEPGASITIDRESRGEYPPLGPLRVVAGYRTVRVYKEGFEPFAQGLDIVGEQTIAIKVRMARLIQAGRLQVEEGSGKKLDILFDGNVVGQTPWEGPVAVGEHAVELRGAENLGAPPKRISVRLHEQAKVVFTAERLDASLKVTPSPGDASVAIDGIFVGRGLWDGRLRPGAHRIKLVVDGYFPEERKVELAQGSDKVVSVVLRRDPFSPAWRKPGRFGLELVGAVPVTPSFGGEIAGSCKGACSAGAAFGGHVVVHGSYQLWNGFGFGVSAGYLSMRQQVTGRKEELKPVGFPPDQGTADDTLKLRGFRAGGWASFRTAAERFPLRLRLGAGALIGSVSDTRSGVFRSGGAKGACSASASMSDQGCFSIGPAIHAPSASFFYVAPEVRVGFRLGGHIEVSVGVEGLLLFGLSSPSWDETLGIFGARDGYATFPKDTLAGSFIGVILPGLGARYDF
jgi:hypothetical protein